MTLLRNNNKLFAFTLNSLTRTSLFFKNNFNVFELYNFSFLTLQHTQTNNLLFSLKRKIFEKNLSLYNIKTYPNNLTYREGCDNSTICYYWESVSTCSVVFHKNKLTKLFLLHMYILLTNYFPYVTN